MKLEIIYYNIWGRDSYYHHLEKLVERDTLEIRESLIEERDLPFVCIQTNCRCFLEAIEPQILNGNEYLDNWLRGLLADYVNRCERDNRYSFDIDERRLEWLQNTINIVRLEPRYRAVIDWCEDYKSWLEEWTHHQPETKTTTQPDLKDYFIAKFKGIGGNTNYYECFIDDLLKIAGTGNKKNLAKCLLLAYNSREFNRSKYNISFAEWLKVCSTNLGNEITNYKPNKLNTDKIEKVFYYFTKIDHQ